MLYRDWVARNGLPTPGTRVVVCRSSGWGAREVIDEITRISSSGQRIMLKSGLVFTGRGEELGGFRRSQAWLRMDVEETLARMTEQDRAREVARILVRVSTLPIHSQMDTETVTNMIRAIRDIADEAEQRLIQKTPFTT